MIKRFLKIMIFCFVWLSGQSAMALSGDQVLELKKAGVSDQTIQLMIQQEMAAKANFPGNAVMREIKDKDGNVVVIYSTGAGLRNLDTAEREKLDKAWNMLQRVIIDGEKVISMDDEEFKTSLSAFRLRPPSGTTLK